MLNINMNAKSVIWNIWAKWFYIANPNIIYLVILVILCPFLISSPTVQALKANRALQELHLSNNQLNSYQDAMQLGDLLRYNNTLQKLELSNNALADGGKFIMFIKEQKPFTEMNSHMQIF